MIFNFNVRFILARPYYFYENTITTSILFLTPDGYFDFIKNCITSLQSEKLSKPLSAVVNRDGG